MDGMWFKRCARCGCYLKKTDPQESGMCCACGWSEYPEQYFCDVIDNYCKSCTAADVDRAVASTPYRLPARQT